MRHCTRSPRSYHNWGQVGHCTEVWGTDNKDFVLKPEGWIHRDPVLVDQGSATTEVRKVTAQSLWDSKRKHIIATGGLSSEESGALNIGACHSWGQTGQMHRGWGDGQQRLGIRTSKLCLRAPMHWASHPGIARAGQQLHRGRSDRQKELGNRTSGLALSDQQTVRQGMPVPRGTAH